MSVNCKCNWKNVVARNPVKVNRNRIAAIARIRHDSNIASKLSSVVATFSSRPKSCDANASINISKCSSGSKRCGNNVRPNNRPSNKAGREERLLRGTEHAAG